MIDVMIQCCRFADEVVDLIHHEGNMFKIEEEHYHEVVKRHFGEQSNEMLWNLAHTLLLNRITQEVPDLKFFIAYLSYSLFMTAADGETIQ